MVLHAVVFAVVFGVEAGVVVQGLAVDGEALRTGFGDRPNSLTRTDMDEIDRTDLLLRQSDCPAEGDILGQVRVDVVHVPPVP